METLKHVPQFTQSQAENLITDLFGVSGSAQALPSERDQNFRITAAGGQQYVLKIANGLEDVDFLDAQQQLLQHLAQTDIDFCPQLFAAKDGSVMPTVEGESGAHIVRLVSFLAGVPMGNVARHSRELLHDLGHKLGRLDAALVGFEHPAAHHTFHWDLAQGLEVVAQHRHLIQDAEQAALVDQFIADIQTNVAPILPTLRTSVIHNDANDYNVIVGSNVPDLGNQIVAGIIDFGDMVHSYTVGNLAIAAAYALLDKPDPIAAAAEIVAGYHAAFALTDDELTALFGLINLRLCVSVCMAAVQMAERPDDEYLAISQQPIRNTMPKLAAIPYGLATAIFRNACGLDPAPQTAKIVDWLSQQTCAPILGRDLSGEETLTLDLSIGGPLLHGDIALNSEPHLTPRIFDAMARAGVDVSIGRYNEPRLIYTEGMFDTAENPLAERRTIHVGLDLFAVAGTPIYAPLGGTVHALAINDAPQDYGGVIILRHETDDGTPFYSLYGHLSHESIPKLAVGQLIKAGDEIATMGVAAENGNWPPHLHLQLVVDLFGLETDFPGVGLASQRDVWRALCPDPNLLVGIAADRLPAADDTFDATLAARKTRVGRNLSLGYRNHLKIARGWRQYLWDHQGAKYLDAYNNVPHVGHCHPHVVDAARRQMGVLNTNTRYLHDLLNEYAERLAATMPDPLNVCFFVNSASEANELALRLARAYTGQRDIIVNEGAYHGHTTSLIDISPYKHDGPGGDGAPDWVHTAPIADVYRGAFKADDPLAAQKYANAVDAIIQKLDADGKGLSGFIAETCPSVGGQIMLPDGYLATVYDSVRKAGGVTIADEVQTGYGRIGSHFYAFEAQNAIPDIVVLGKPIGNGHPIGAVVTTAEIADAFDNGMEFFSTFGGNTVSCAVGLAVLDVLEAEDLQAQAQRVGQRILDGLTRLMDRFDIVGDVRGSGLFLGVELVRDRKTLEPAAAEASFVSNQLREHHILVGTDGPLHNVVKIRPPMPFDEGNADLLVETFENILKADFG